MTASSSTGPNLVLRILLVLTAAVVSATVAWAQQTRPVALPANATFGELTGFEYPEAKIGKKVLRLSPAAKIYNTQNLIVMPSTVTGKSGVLYRVDSTGQISHLWLLTAEEANARRPKLFKTAPAQPASATEPAGVAR